MNNTTKLDSRLTRYLKNGRRLKETELYQKIYGKKVNAHVKDEISKKGAGDRSDRMRIRVGVVNTLWEKDKDKPEVREAIDAAKSRQMEEKKKVEKSEERIPEEYQK